jgi:hypothetical protein
MSFRLKTLLGGDAEISRLEKARDTARKMLNAAVSDEEKVSPLLFGNT